MNFVVEHGTWEDRPPEVDMNSCPGKVYVRRNIHRETVGTGEEAVEEWVCEMALMTLDEFAAYSQTVALEKQTQMDATLAEILLNQMEV